jgi:cobalt-zinc-cadmium efflux system outer membrane protein
LNTARGARRRAAPELAYAAAALVAAGCYHPRPLDARALMNELAPHPEDGSAAAAARPAITPPPGLTEEAAVAFAMRGNPDLRALRLARGIAEGEVVAAGALANPTIGFDVIHIEDWVKTETKTEGWALQLGWQPPQPEAYAAKRAAARAGAQAVDADVAEAEWQVATSVRAAHAALLTLADKRALVEKELEARRKIVDLVRKRVAGGASTRLDLGVAQLAVAQVEREHDELAADQIEAGTLLGQLLGTTPVSDVAGALAGETRSPPALDALVDAALDARPALAAEERRYHQREENVRLERAQRFPWFKFTAIPRYRADGSDVHPRDFSAGIELTVPILNLNGGPIQIAEASRDREREQFAKLVGGIRRDLAGARQEIELRAVTLRRYQADVLPGLDAQEKLLATAVAGGQIDIVALTTAEDGILRTRSTYVDLKLAAYRAWLALDRAVGRRQSTPASP